MKNNAIMYAENNARVEPTIFKNKLVPIISCANSLCCVNSLTTNCSSPSVLRKATNETIAIAKLNIPKSFGPKYLATQAVTNKPPTILTILSNRSHERLPLKL